VSEELSFEAALARLDEIVAQVKQGDVSLDQSLELLEEGVRLANACTEKTDHTYWREELKDSD
jgi:exodeoxyribonuclease VII small subunit